MKNSRPSRFRLGPIGLLLPLACFWPAASAQSPLPAAPAPLSELDRFDYVLGTETFNPSYQFTAQTMLVETADAIHALGSTVIKFALDSQYFDTAHPLKHNRSAKGYVPRQNPAIQSLVELARDEPSHRHVLDLPFANYIIWTHSFSNPTPPTSPNSWHDGFSKEAQAREYREFYDLAAWLLKHYTGTGKTFYLGHWEGDGMLRGRVGKEYDVRATPVAIQGMIDWLTARQKAVDDAKRDTPHRDVEVWHYTEVNHVVIARDQNRPTVVNKVLPYVPVDFVSYSSWDTTTEPNPANIKSALDYIESKLTPKPGIVGKRVFIGEYGYPLVKREAYEQPACTPQQQDTFSRLVMRTGLEWGSPFVLYWELYDNEVYPDGTQRGFWMIDNKGVKQPIYYTHQEFYQAARHYVANTIAKTGHAPTSDEYRQAALAILSKIPANP